MWLAPDEAKIGSFSPLYLPVHGSKPRSDDNGYVVWMSRIVRKV
jgi:hypothetical protein